MLAAAAAPAIVRSSSLMKIYVPPQQIFTYSTIARYTLEDSRTYAQMLAKSLIVTKEIVVSTILNQAFYTTQEDFIFKLS